MAFKSRIEVRDPRNNGVITWDIPENVRRIYADVPEEGTAMVEEALTTLLRQFAHVLTGGALMPSHFLQSVFPEVVTALADVSERAAVTVSAMGITGSFRPSN